MSETHDATPADDEAGFWIAISQPSLEAVWDNADDDVYQQLLQG
ncbi:MAG TPA: hypothetical protein VF746_17635 [Longimicrobium sp.]|jgi:hypothetical protein